MSLGLCVSPGNVPDSAELAALRPKFLRSVLHSMADLDILLATGLPLMLTINNEMQETGWWSAWEQAIRAIANRAGGRVLALSCGNELDLFNSRNPTDVPPEFAADLVRRASPILRAAGIKVATTSLAGPSWPDYLARMIALCRDAVDYVDLHAYGQRPDGWGAPGWGFGDLRPTLSRIRQDVGKPVIMSEYGCKIGDAGGEDQVASFLTAGAATVAALGPDVCPLASWFAWRDQVGAPDERGPSAFGLVAEDGRHRSAWAAFAAVNATPVPVPVPDPEPVPTPEPEPLPVLAADQAALMDIWRAVRSDVPFNPEAAFCRYWLDHIADMGSPVGPEHVADDGSVWQGYTRGRFKWAGGDEVVAA